MSLNKLILALSVVSILHLGAGYAQSNTKPVLPPGPLVARVPKTGTWSVTYFYLAEARGQTPAVNLNTRSVLVESDGSLTHIKIIQVGGVVEDRWKSKGGFYHQWGDKSPWLSVQPTSGESNLSANEFPGLRWIQPDYFVGIVNYQDSKCLLFIMGPHDSDINDSTALADKIKSSSTMALIDLSTRLPIEVHLGGVKEVFQFGPAPSNLSFPKSLSDQLSAYGK